MISLVIGICVIDTDFAVLTPGSDGPIRRLLAVPVEMDCEFDLLTSLRIVREHLVGAVNPPVPVIPILELVRLELVEPLGIVSTLLRHSTIIPSVDSYIEPLVGL